MTGLIVLTVIAALLVLEARHQAKQLERWVLVELPDLIIAVTANVAAFIQATRRADEAAASCTAALELLDLEPEEA